MSVKVANESFLKDLKSWVLLAYRVSLLMCLG